MRMEPCLLQPPPLLLCGVKIGKVWESENERTWPHCPLQLWKETEIPASTRAVLLMQMSRLRQREGLSYYPPCHPTPIILASYKMGSDLTSAHGQSRTKVS